MASPAAVASLSSLGGAEQTPECDTDDPESSIMSILIKLSFPRTTAVLDRTAATFYYIYVHQQVWAGLIHLGKLSLWSELGAPRSFPCSLQSLAVCPL